MHRVFPIWAAAHLFTQLASAKLDTRCHTVCAVLDFFSMYLWLVPSRSEEILLAYEILPPNMDRISYYLEV